MNFYDDNFTHFSSKSIILQNRNSMTQKSEISSFKFCDFSGNVQICQQLGHGPLVKMSSNCSTEAFAQTPFTTRPVSDMGDGKNNPTPLGKTPIALTTKRNTNNNTYCKTRIFQEHQIFAIKYTQIFGIAHHHEFICIEYQHLHAVICNILGIM